MGGMGAAPGAAQQAIPPGMMQKGNILFSKADVIDYEIIGDDMQMVEIVLDPGESVIAEAGANQRGSALSLWLGR